MAIGNQPCSRCQESTSGNCGQHYGNYSNDPVYFENDTGREIVKRLDEIIQLLKELEYFARTRR